MKEKLMKRNGMYALDFNAPALDGGQLIYLRGSVWRAAWWFYVFPLTLA